MTTLAIDMMSGDYGDAITVPAAVSFSKKHKAIKLLLVGDEARLVAALLENGITLPHAQLSIVASTQLVEMTDKPAVALRMKKDSSMRVAINCVKDGSADAVISAGNTGALMATARFVLKMIPGIDRPAICTALPRPDGHVHMLDLGANVDVSAEVLLQFAHMGVAIAHCVDGDEAPTVGLLNIGSEDVKGNDTIKSAARLIKESNLNYIGFVEGDDIYIGDCHVIVCDGLIGNVALKTSEGLAQLIKRVMKESFSRNIFTKMAAFVAQKVLRSIADRIDHRRYNGASLMGLNGIVVKSHGRTDAFGFENAIDMARKEAESDIIKDIKSRLNTSV